MERPTFGNERLSVGRGFEVVQYRFRDFATEFSKYLSFCVDLYYTVRKMARRKK